MKTTNILAVALATVVSYPVLAVESKIAGALNHTIFIDQGTVFGMGSNNIGQVKASVNQALNTSTAAMLYTPVLAGITNAKSVTSNYQRSAVLTTTGSIVYFGRDVVNNKVSNTITLNVNATDFAMSSKGVYYISSGVVYFWNFATTTAISDTKLKATSVAAGQTHAVVLFSDGTVGTVGDGSYGQLGNGFTTAANVTMVTGLTGITKIVAGDYESFAYNAKTVYGWGKNGSYQLGLNHTKIVSLPVELTALATATKVVADSSCVMALMPNKTIKSAGNHNFIGGSVYNKSKVFTELPGIVDALDVASGYEQRFIDFGVAGVLRGWGGNSNGQLGDGTQTERHALSYTYYTPVATPKPVVTPPVVTQPVTTTTTPVTTTTQAVVTTTQTVTTTTVPASTNPFLPIPVLFCSMNDCLKNSNNSAKQCQALLVPSDRGNSNCKSK